MVPVVRPTKGIRAGAVVLAGGRASRMAGVDKLGADVAGMSVLARVLRACEGVPVVLVGPPGLAADFPGTTVVQEDPSFGGPVAGVRAGVSGLHTDCDRVLLLAGDAPFLTPAALQRLLERLESSGADAALYADATGQEQYLCAAWRRLALTRALGAAGNSMRSVYAGARLAVLPDTEEATTDVDTMADLDAARARARAQGPGCDDSGAGK